MIVFLKAPKVQHIGKIIAGAVHIDLLRQEIERMITLAGDNVEKCYKAVLNSDSSLMKKVLETEETIDALNK